MYFGLTFVFNWIILTVTVNYAAQLGIDWEIFCYYLGKCSWPSLPEIVDHISADGFTVICHKRSLKVSANCHTQTRLLDVSAEKSSWAMVLYLRGTWDHLWSFAFKCKFRSLSASMGWVWSWWSLLAGSEAAWEVFLLFFLTQRRALEYCACHRDPRNNWGAEEGLSPTLPARMTRTLIFSCCSINSVVRINGFSAFPLSALQTLASLFLVLELSCGNAVCLFSWLDSSEA